MPQSALGQLLNHVLFFCVCLISANVKSKRQDPSKSNMELKSIEARLCEIVGKLAGQWEK